MSIPTRAARSALPIALRSLLGLALLLPAASAQEITGLDGTEGTLGTEFQVLGTDLGPKPKLALVQDGELVKKTKLKVVGKGDGTSSQVQLKKAPAGVYNVAVRKGKTLLSVSKDTFTVRGPEILDVVPGSAQPGDEVVATVAWLGDVGKPRVEVGLLRAKVKGSEPVPVEGDTPVWEVTFVVPKVGDGVWPVLVQNRVGTDILKGALDVNGSPVDITKAGALFDIEGLKPLKSNSKKIIVNQDNDNFDVVAFAGGKKAPRTLTVTIPGQLRDLEAGMSFTTAPTNIAYAQIKKGTESVWLADLGGPTGGWAVDVIAVGDDLMTLSVCGILTNVEGPGAESIFVNGVVTAPRSDNTVDPEAPCDPFAEATFSTLPMFEATPQFGNVFATYMDIGPTAGTLNFGMANSAGPVNYGISTVVDFNPNTQTSAVINGINLMGQGMRSFAYTHTDGMSWTSQLDMLLATSMTITITDNLPSLTPDDGARGYLTGTFTGTITNVLTMDTQTVSGAFCTGWNNFSDF